MQRQLLSQRISPMAALRGIAIVLAVCFMSWQGTLFALRLYEEQVDRLDGETAQTPLEDYIVFYAAGRLVLEDQGDLLYDVEAVGAKEREILGRPVGIDGTLAYFNPPFVAAALALPALLDVGTFTLVFLLFSLAVFVASMHWLSRLIALSGWRLALFWIGVLSLKGTFWLLIQGQLSMLLLLGWIGFAASFMQGRPRHAGLFLALTLVKPQMAIPVVLVLIWKRQWETLRPFAATATALVALSVAVSGPQVLIDYPQYLLHSTGFDGQGILTGNMYGLNGLVARLTGDQTPSPLLLLIVYAPFLGLTVQSWVAARTEALRSAFPALFAMTLLTSLLINPHLYLQDLTLLVVIAAFAVLHRLTNGQGTGAWPLLTIAMWFLQFYTHRLAEGLNLNLLTPLMLIMFTTLYIQLRSRTRSAGQTSTLEQASRAVTHAEIAAA